MSNYDVAIGLDDTSLDSGMKGLYGNSQAYQKWFKGSQKQGANTVSWEVKAAPTFTLSAGGQDWTHWKDSITDGSGSHPTGAAPTTNAFKLDFSQFYGSITTVTPPATKDGTTEVIVYGEVKIASDQLTITPLSIWLDETKMNFWELVTINTILGEVLTKMTTVLAGIKIPPLSFEGVDLSAPVVSIADGRLVLASCLKSKGAPDISGVTWPTDDLFTLISQDVLNALLPKLATQLKGKSINKSGSKGRGSYDFSATVDDITNPVAYAGADPPAVKADLDLDWSLSCSACAMSSATP